VSSPEQENYSLHQVWGLAVRAAHPSDDRLRVPNVRCKHLFQEDACVAAKCLRTASGSPW
jgi:hypothetical protein